MHHVTLSEQLRPPEGLDALPSYDLGWTLDDGTRAPFLSYAALDHEVNWSEDLEALHEEGSRSHFIDVWTRRSMLERADIRHGTSTVLDLGCSTGYLLEDLSRAHPGACLIGIDLVGAGLRKAHEHVPEARLLRADACALPLGDETVDCLLSANLLEHVPNDRGALAEMARVLRPGGRAVVVVPANPGLYDYYDRFLGHERRYERGELADKGRGTGRLRVLEDCYLGSLIYPAFWLVKQRNRRRHAYVDGDAAAAQVAEDMDGTSASTLGRLACGLERALLARGVRLPFGIRNLVVFERC